RAGLAGDPADVVDPELRACEEQRGAERLDLQVTLQLCLQAEADAAGSDQEERQDEDAAGDEQRDRRPTRRPQAPPGEWQRDDAVDLDRDVGAEQRSRRETTRTEECDERK